MSRLNCILNKNLITSCCGTMMLCLHYEVKSFFLQAEDGIRDRTVTGVQTCVFRSQGGTGGAGGAGRGDAAHGTGAGGVALRSEERRVGKECRLRVLAYSQNKNEITSCIVTMMLFVNVEVRHLMTLQSVLYLSCAVL